MQYSPVVLFCYNRPEHTAETLAALSANSLSQNTSLIIYCDGPKTNSDNAQLEKIERVRKLVKSKKWCGEVIVNESDINQGLANSIIRGVTETVNEYGAVIVLEDDLVTSRYFLDYMNAALEKYAAEDEVMQVSAHFFPLKGSRTNNSSFLIPFTTSWGWATWKRAWQKFDAEATGYEKLKTDNALVSSFNLQNAYPYSRMLFQQMETTNIDSWAIRWWWSVFKNNGLTLFPDKALVKNIGFGNGATHTDTHEFVNEDFDQNYSIRNFPEKVMGNDDRLMEIIAYLKNLNSSSSAPKEGIASRIIKSIFK